MPIISTPLQTLREVARTVQFCVQGDRDTSVVVGCTFQQTFTVSLIGTASGGRVNAKYFEQLCEMPEDREFLAIIIVSNTKLSFFFRNSAFSYTVKCK